MEYPALIERMVTNPEYYPLLGFTIIRNVLNSAEVSLLRDDIDDFFTKQSEKRMLLPRHVLETSAFYSNAFHPKIVAPLKKIFGENYVQWGDFQIQRNMFGGWHADCNSEGLAPYLFDNQNYRFAKCGLYLQENTGLYGGGIQIGLFSHKFLFGSKNPILRRMLGSFYNVFKKTAEHRVKLNAGDFICFDSRLLHSSTWPQQSSAEKQKHYGARVIDLPKDVAKYVLYWNVCNQQSEADFIRNSMHRSLLDEFLKDAEEVFFSDYIQRLFPHDYPSEFAEYIEKNALKMASLDSHTAIKFKEIYSKLVS